jgi:predicted MFS family arabinose efflux permease
MLARSGLGLPFIALALAGVFMAAAILWVIPPGQPRPAGETRTGLGNLRLVLSLSPARAILAMMVCFGALNEWMMVVFGLWMESSFALQVAALGASAAVIGAAEIGGEFAGGAGLVDRLGKKRAVRLGLALNIAALLAMPWLGGFLWGALVALFFYYLGFEFAFVSTLPLASEVTPMARATLMGAIVAAISIGRVISASLSPLIFTSWGFTSNTIAALVLSAAALLFLSLVRLQASSEG